MRFELRETITSQMTSDTPIPVGDYDDPYEIAQTSDYPGKARDLINCLSESTEMEAMSEKRHIAVFTDEGILIYEGWDEVL